MWRSRTNVSWRDILNLGFGQRSIAEVSAQKGRRVEINLPAKNFGEFALKAEKLQARHECGIEFDEHIHVAAWPEVVTQDRSEQRQLPDVMPAAKLRDTVSGNFYPRASHFAQNSFATAKFRCRNVSILYCRRTDLIGLDVRKSP
jgi:hypothetical protein